MYINNRSGLSSIVIAIGVFAVLTIVGGYFIINRPAPSPAPTPVPIPSPNPTPAPTPTTGSTITLTGDMVCLPHKGSGPHTMECAFGLKSGGVYYDLKDVYKIDPTYQFSTTEIVVTVTGRYQKDDGSSQYDIVGTITVSEIKLVSTKSPPPPTPVPSTGSEIVLKEGQREGPFLLQKIYPTYVTGLAYREYPLATNEGSPITLHIGESVSNGCTITLTLLRIGTSTATFKETKDFNRPCPICLAAGTLIATPDGGIAIENLKQGAIVWTTDINGHKIAAPVLKVVKTPVPLTHQVVDIKLADGRELFASEGHPTSDGRFIGNLEAGDILDGNRVISATRITYGQGYTYDILPAGGTGTYRANGILIGSTLLRVR